MLYDAEAILAEVRTGLNLNSRDNSLVALGDIDALSINRRILHTIEHTGVELLRQAPTPLLGSGRPIDADIGWWGVPGASVGYVPLPADFERLVAFRMSDWHCQGSLIADAEVMPWLHSPVPGIGGTPHHPLLVLTYYGTERILEFYGCHGGAGVSLCDARYVPTPHVSDDGLFYYPSPLYHQLIQQTTEYLKHETDHTPSTLHWPL